MLERWKMYCEWVVRTRLPQLKFYNYMPNLFYETEKKFFFSPKYYIKIWYYFLNVNSKYQYGHPERTHFWIDTETQKFIHYIWILMFDTIFSDDTFVIFSKIYNFYMIRYFCYFILVNFKLLFQTTTSLKNKQNIKYGRFPSCLMKHIFLW